jgi:hypothetical protein
MPKLRGSVTSVEILLVLRRFGKRFVISLFRAAAATVHAPQPEIFKDLRTLNGVPS